MNLKKINPDFFIVAGLISIFFIIALNSITYKSPTFDETVHLTGGYVALTDKDYRINPENGILPQKWAAIPLLFNKIKGPDKSHRYWEKGLNWNISSQFLFKSGNNFERMFLLSRIMILLASCGTGIVVFFASKKIWGKNGAYISLILFILSPTILAHSRFITSDLFSALFFFLSAWSFQLLLDRFSLSRLLGMSISISFLFLSKMSAPVIIPIILILICIRLYRRKPLRGNFFKKSFVIRDQWKQTLISIGSVIFAGLITFVVMWGMFSFRYSMLSDGKGKELLEKRWELILSDNDFPAKTISMLKNYQILPEAYIYGLGHALHKSKIRYSFLNGKYSKTGWWYFFPLTFLIKTPLPVILLILMGFLSLIFAKSQKRTLVRLKSSSFIIVLVSVYLIFSFANKLNIGHRHLLVIYPPLFVIAGGVAQLAKTTKFGKIVVYFLFGILILETLFIHPHYLTYFNPIAGGPKQGYKHLVDSSLDWGQELKGLKKWIKQNEIPNEKIYIAYFGSTDLTAYGFPQKRLLCYFEQNTPEVFPLKEGTYCLSATMLQMAYYPELALWSNAHEQLLLEYRKYYQKLQTALNDKKMYQIMLQEKPAIFWIEKYRIYERLRFAKLAYYIRNKKPDNIIGNSILVYNLKKKDIEEIIGKELAK